MPQIISRSPVEYIAERVEPLRSRLSSHQLYAKIKTQRHLQIFMQSHVFAVWDFMSLLKNLQSKLSCTTAPWLPTAWPESRRFINEIVFGEESDTYHGRSLSHFELYVEAMEECGANTASIRSLLAQVAVCPSNMSLSASLENAAAPLAARSFVETTFDIIQTGSLAAQAAAFTFGREDLIPDIFRHLVSELNRTAAGTLDKFIWYLERHIEVDGEDHGPLSLRMVADLCGADESLWEPAATAAESAILARLKLWDGILTEL